ncbi:cardiolipin synthase [Paenibacillus swuensis]|uniref:Cardiolipin synthase n=1 Tax=Paenibacillus swuensis TaxID=1178515 RepID=A0A172TQ61_9BACL|nr:cardiolipin synthase [Paenibacillus swuensis]
MATILILEFRHPSKTIAWMFILFIFPIIGFVMYYFLAKEYKHRRRVRRKGSLISKEVREFVFKEANIVRKPEDVCNDEFMEQHRLFGLLQALPDSPITTCNETQVLTNAEQTYEAIFRAIEGAKHHVHVEYYIFQPDKIGTKFRDLLIRKAQEGVEVRLIVDGVGSHNLGAKFLKPLKDAGIEQHFFLPPMVAFFDKRVNYRNHRKIVVVDGLTGFLGGINIGDEHLGANEILGFWRDTHLRVTGDAVYFLQHTFLTDWAFVSKRKITHLEYFPKHGCVGKEQVQIISSGPDVQWDSILEMIFGAITVAKKRIWIASPYFIPDDSIYMALKTAAVSGLDVRLVLPGIPDSRLVELAAMSYLEELMQAGVRVFSYQKGFIHAKIMVIDNMLATVGTANMDMRSFFSNFELNAVMFDKKSIRRIEEDFQQDLKDSKELDLKEFSMRSRMQRSKEVLARLLSPLL